MSIAEELRRQGWHLTEKGLKRIQANDEAMDAKRIIEVALHLDFRDIAGGALPAKREDSIAGNIVLQLVKMRNVAAPKANEESKTAPRLLQLELTDGQQTIQALEMEHIAALSLNVPPGTKLLFRPDRLHLMQGFIAMTAAEVRVLGGLVEPLVEKWEIARTMLKYASGGRPHSGTGGPPPWVQFGKRLDAHKEDLAAVGKFKSLQAALDKSDKAAAAKENDEFQAMRKEAIAEAAKAGVKKVFSGGGQQMLDHNMKKCLEKGYELEEVKQALRATHNNLERALYYLKRNQTRGSSFSGSESVPAATTAAPAPSYVSSGPPSGRGGGRGSGRDRDGGRRGGGAGGGRGGGLEEVALGAPKANVSLFDFLTDKLPSNGPQVSSSSSASAPVNSSSAVSSLSAAESRSSAAASASASAAASRHKFENNLSSSFAANRGPEPGSTIPATPTFSQRDATRDGSSEWQARSSGRGGGASGRGRGGAGGSERPRGGGAGGRGGGGDGSGLDRGGRGGGERGERSDRGERSERGDRGAGRGGGGRSERGGGSRAAGENRSERSAADKTERSDRSVGGAGGRQERGGGAAADRMEGKARPSNVNPFSGNVRSSAASSSATSSQNNNQNSGEEGVSRGAIPKDGGSYQRQNGASERNGGSAAARGKEGGNKRRGNENRERPAEEPKGRSNRQQPPNATTSQPQPQGAPQQRNNKSSSPVDKLTESVASMRIDKSQRSAGRQPATQPQKQQDAAQANTTAPSGGKSQRHPKQQATNGYPYDPSKIIGFQSKETNELAITMLKSQGIDAPSVTGTTPLMVAAGPPQTGPTGSAAASVVTTLPPPPQAALLPTPVAVAAAASPATATVAPPAAHLVALSTDAQMTPLLTLPVAASMPLPPGGTLQFNVAAPPLMTAQPPQFAMNNNEAAAAAAALMYHRAQVSPTATITPPPQALMQPPPQDSRFGMVCASTYPFKCGDICLAKYWDDGRYYEAEITAVSDKTCVVYFLGYGNHEEVLKTDCLPITDMQNIVINNYQQSLPSPGHEERAAAYHPMHHQGPPPLHHHMEHQYQGQQQYHRNNNVHMNHGGGGGGGGIGAATRYRGERQMYVPPHKRETYK